MKCEWSPSTSSSYRTCQRSGVSRFDPSDHENCGSPLCGNVAPLCAQCGKPTVHRHGYVSTHAPEQCIAELRAQLAAAEAKLATAQSELKVAWSDCHDGLCHACAKCYDAAEAKLATAVEALQKAARWADALNTLRTLGIDPSKEHEK